MNILVVDDSPTARHIIRIELEAGGYNVIEASGGNEVLEKIEKFTPALITLDVEMPRLNGYQVCSYLRRLNVQAGAAKNADSRVPIVFITSDDTLEGREKGFHAGATDFIKKPFAKGRLLQAVDGILKPGALYAGFRALVVDDSKMVRSIVVDILKPLGLKVIEAEDGKEALDYLKSNPESVDIVISDLHMPNLNGMELCREIRHGLGLAELPVLILSADSETESVTGLFQSGANDFIVKPFTKEVLIARVNSQLRNRRLMRELNQQVKELKRLSRLKDDFIAITSQDLRSPLASILTSVDMLQLQACTPEESSEFLGTIHRTGTGLLNLIDDLIVLSKLQSDKKSLELKPIPLFEELKHSLIPFRDLIQAKNLNIDTAIDFKHPPIVLANVDAIFKIMDHLVSIAIDCSPPGATISIRVAPQGADAVAVLIEDSGPGMSTEQLKTLFEWVGSSTRHGGSRAKGQGLGFLIVHDLVEKQNATIQVFSTPGEGTKVKIVFPLEMEALSA